MIHQRLLSSTTTDKDLMRETPNKLHFDFGGLNHIPLSILVSLMSLLQPKLELVDNQMRGSFTCIKYRRGEGIRTLEVATSV